MKKAVNLRLEENTVILLNSLSKELKTTKTDIIEQAIWKFSDLKTKKHNQLMAFAGKLDPKEADMILETIAEARVNKDLVLDLK